MQQELRLIGKTDTDLQLQPRKMDGAGGAPLSLHKKMAALQQPKDPMDSLHQCDSCFVSEALPTLPQCYTPGLLFPSTSPGLALSPGSTPLPALGCLPSLESTLGSCPLGLGRF